MNKPKGEGGGKDGRLPKIIVVYNRTRTLCFVKISGVCER